jgi:hypothetical protein
MMTTMPVMPTSLLTSSNKPNFSLLFIFLIILFFANLHKSNYPEFY